MAGWWWPPVPGPTPPVPPEPPPPNPPPVTPPAPGQHRTSTILDAADYGLSAQASAAVNTAAMVAAIQDVNRVGALLLVPGGQFKVRAPLPPFRAAGRMEGVGAFSSQSSGTTFQVEGEGPLFSAEAVPVWLKHFCVVGGDTALSCRSMSGGGIDGLVLVGQRTPLVMVDSTLYSLRSSQLLSYRDTGLTIAGTGTPQDGGDTSVDDLTFSGLAETGAVRWKGMGGLRVINSKILLQAPSARPAIELHPVDGVHTSDLLVTHCSLEGPYAAGILCEADPDGWYSNVQIGKVQITGLRGPAVTLDTPNLAIVTLNDLIVSGGTASVLLDVRRGNDVYIGNCLFHGNGQLPTAIRVAPAAVNVTIGPNHFGTGIGVPVDRA